MSWKEYSDELLWEQNSKKLVQILIKITTIMIIMMMMIIIIVHGLPRKLSVVNCKAAWNI